MADWKDNSRIPCDELKVSWKAPADDNLVVWWTTKSGRCVFKYPPWQMRSAGPSAEDQHVHHEVAEAARCTFAELETVKSALGLSQFHPRVHHNVLGVQRDRHYEAWLGSVTSASLVLRGVGEVLDVVQPSRDNLAAYGHRIRQLLLLACTEVESAWAGVLTANGRDGRFTTQDYVSLLGPMRLNEWVLEWPHLPELGQCAPFAEWDSSRPTQSLSWYEAYNATKHNREASLARANLGTLLTAVAGVLVMIAAQFGPDMTVDTTPLLQYRFVEHPRWSPEELYFGHMEQSGRWIDHETLRWSPVGVFDT